jgi:hypothetical protein
MNSTATGNGPSPSGWATKVVISPSGVLTTISVSNIALPPVLCGRVALIVNVASAEPQRGSPFADGFDATQNTVCPKGGVTKRSRKRVTGIAMLSNSQTSHGFG